MTAKEDLLALVRSRAGDRCEYCQMHQSLQGATFHLEHVIPLSHGGETAEQNLALACPGCNLRKSDRVRANDPLTDASVSLFHPRRDRWSEHFRFDGFTIIPLTTIGRATAAALDLNHARRLTIREAEARFDLFPPN